MSSTSEATSKTSPNPRKIPLAVAHIFPDGSKRDIQVNFCKNPHCGNFGLPASLEKYARRSKSSPGAPGTEYTLGAAGAGFPVLVCKLCGESLPMKSNMGIAEEVCRLTEYIKPTELLVCPNIDCENHRLPVNGNKKAYYAFGTTTQGSKRYKCRSCGNTFSVRQRATLRQRLPQKNLQVFRLLMNKMPMTRICEVADISIQTLYDKIDFIHRQSLVFLAEHERRFLEGFSTPRLYVAVDRQDYVVNWTQRKDKRNITLRALGSADLTSGYVFGMHLNFDSGLDSLAIEADAETAGDYAAQYPFRRYARLWLEGDYAKAVKETADRLSKKLKGGITLGDDIAAAYSEAEARTDVEASELITSASRFPAKGMQVRNEYTLYAHFYWLRQMFKGVEKVRFFLDQESGIRAACLSAFEAEVKAKTCEAFYVRLAKEMTVDEKRKIVAASRVAFDEALAANKGATRAEVEVLMMKAEIERAAAIGKWSDRWATHPFPNSSEPDKAMCWLTNRLWDEKDEAADNEKTQAEFDDHMARLHLKASLHAIDRFFMQIRRRLSLLERPIGTSSKAGRTWYGYSAYKPENIVKLLDIFRVFYNYCLPDKKGETPAMRIGLADRPMEPQDILQFMP